MKIKKRKNGSKWYPSTDKNECLITNWNNKHIESFIKDKMS